MPTEFSCNDCALSFSVGWFHYHTSESGYGSRTTLVCKECGTQHAIEHAEPLRSFSPREKYDILITAVPKEDLFEALGIVRNVFRCTSQEAKKRLDHLPCCLAWEVDGYDAQSLAARFSGTGIEIETPFSDRRPATVVDRLLGAVKPCQANEKYVLVEVPIAMPLISERSIDLTIQKCQGCKAIGSFVGEHEPPVACPRCKKRSLVITSKWIS